MKQIRWESINMQKTIRLLVNGQLLYKGLLILFKSTQIYIEQGSFEWLKRVI